MKSSKPILYVRMPSKSPRYEYISNSTKGSFSTRGSTRSESTRFSFTCKLLLAIQYIVFIAMVLYALLG